MKFFGRTDLLLDLGALWGKNVASLVTCRGRRRIGKSTLIKRFAEESDARFIKIEGLRPERGLTNDDQLRSFAQQLALQTDDDGAVQSNWLGAFKRLSNQIRKGLAFENLIVNHYCELLPYLHMAEALVYSAAPYSKRGRRGEGFQIDLLI